MPVVGRDQYVETATQLNDSFESGLLLSFLEASDAGAIAPSLLSPHAGADRFPTPPNSSRGSRDWPDDGGRPSVDGWRGEAYGDAADDRGHFNIFGKKHNYAPPSIIAAGFSPALFGDDPPSPGRLSLPFGSPAARLARAARPR